MLILAVVTNTAAPLVLTATISKIRQPVCIDNVSAVNDHFNVQHGTRQNKQVNLSHS